MLNTINYGEFDEELPEQDNMATFKHEYGNNLRTFTMEIAKIIEIFGLNTTITINYGGQSCLIFTLVTNDIGEMIKGTQRNSEGGCKFVYRPPSPQKKKDA